MDFERMEQEKASNYELWQRNCGACACPRDGRAHHAVTASPRTGMHEFQTKEEELGEVVWACFVYFSTFQLLNSHRPSLQYFVKILLIDSSRKTHG